MKFWLIYSNLIEDKNVPNLMLGEALNQGLDTELFFYQNFKIEEEKLFYNNEKITDYPDVILFRGFDIALMQFFEKKGIYLINSSKTTKLTRDKWEIYKNLKKIKIKQPKTILVTENTTYEELVKHLKSPFVLKDRMGHKGINVFLITTKKEYEKALKQKGVTYIAQTFIKHSYGKDIRAFVIGKTIIPIKRINTHNGFKTNLSDGITATKTILTKEETLLVKKIARRIGLEIGSVDFLINKNELVLCEANSNAGYVSFFNLGYDLHEKFISYIKKNYYNFINVRNQNKNLKEKNNSFEILSGKNCVMVSAPHNIMQIRNLKTKNKDTGTGDLALRLYNIANCHLILKTNLMGKAGEKDDDPNFELAHPYKTALEEHIKKNNIKVLLDIHALSQKRSEEFDIGINDGKNIQGNYELLNLITTKIKENFKVEIDSPFSAPDYTVSGYEASKCNIFCLQIEINSRFINFSDTNNKFDLISKMFKEIITIIENYYKKTQN